MSAMPEVISRARASPGAGVWVTPVGCWLLTVGGAGAGHAAPPFSNYTKFRHRISKYGPDFPNNGVSLLLIIGGGGSLEESAPTRRGIVVKVPPT